ncbi:hypothetical protein YK56LOC_15200 [Caballeronia sp. HLA56]
MQVHCRLTASLRLGDIAKQHGNPYFGDSPAKHVAYGIAKFDCNDEMKGIFVFLIQPRVGGEERKNVFATDPEISLSKLFQQRANSINHRLRLEIGVQAEMYVKRAFSR